MSCSKHNNKPLSLYCKDCKKSMCCICAQVDSKHAAQHSDMQTEIQRRKEELQGMSTELMRKKSEYLDSCTCLQELVKDKVKKKDETKELIQQTLSELMQEKERQLVGAVEEKHNQEVQDLNEKIEFIEGVVTRMESTERLVEMVHLSASDQNVLDMHLIIRESLEEIEKTPLPVVDSQMPAENFTDVITQLQTLIECVIGEKAWESNKDEQCSSNQSSGETNVTDGSVKSPPKRKNVQQGKSIQTPPKVFRTGADDSEQRASTRQAGRCLQEDQPGTSSAPVSGGSHAAGSDIRDTSEAGSLFSSFVSESIDTGDSGCLDSCPEEESSDEESLDANVVEGSLREAIMCPVSDPMVLGLGQSTLVFFDLKILPGKTLHLVAVRHNSDQCFAVTFRPQLVRDSGNMKISLCEHGLDGFLRYLRTLYMPILVGYNPWRMNIPALVTALEATAKEEGFKASIFGFLNALPLIKEKIPNATSYTLKYLDREYLQGQMNDTQAEDCAMTLKNLFTVLEINPMMGRNPVQVIAYSSLRCYTSLQPLLKEKLLSKTSAQTLALHNVDLSKLQLVFQENSGYGLQRFARFLNSNLRNNEKKIMHLSKIRSYFQTQSLATQLYMPSATNDTTLYTVNIA